MRFKIASSQACISEAQGEYDGRTDPLGPEPTVFDGGGENIFAPAREAR